LPDGTVDSGTIATGTIVDADVANVAASKLTGALPAISGANLTGLPADATKAPLANPTFTGTVSKAGSSSGTSKIFTTASDASENYIYIGTGATKFRKQDDSANTFEIMPDGRGLSQFTAKAWCNANFNDSTPDINDSFNVSSIEYFGSTGYFGFHWDVDTADGDYAALVNCAVATSVNTGYVDYGFAQNSSYLRFQFYRNSSLYNPAKGYVVIFGD